jgi:predicted PurR-regulated permease PerM
MLFFGSPQSNVGDRSDNCVIIGATMNFGRPSYDLPRITLGVLFIGLMIVASLWVLQPFIGATIWAATIVVATWPMMLALQARLGGRRWLAVGVMTLGLLLVVVLPVALAVSTIVEHANQITDWARAVLLAGIPLPPTWVARIPFFGTNIAEEWTRLAATSRSELAEQAAPYVRQAIQWFAGRAGGIGLTVIHLLLTLVISTVLYATGETAGKGVRRFARRLAADRGEAAVVLAGQAVRAVALGVVVTAIVQSAAAGIGLVISGVPFAAVLTAIILVLCIAQLGPVLILGPAVGWLYWSGDAVWGTVLLVWTLFVGTLDNFLRPALIRRGADLPLLLIFAGVIGGLIGFGVIGLFVGPVLLAVTYRLLESWVAEADRDLAVPAEAAPAPAASETQPEPRGGSGT